MRSRSRLLLLAAAIAPAVIACSLLTNYDLTPEKAAAADADTDASMDATGTTDAPLELDGAIDADIDAGTVTCTQKPCVVQLVAGGLATCARFDTGEVWCWGRNETGVVGASTAGDYATPNRVAFDGPVDEIVMGTWSRWPFACARRGTVIECWGDDGGNNAMKLGRGVAAGFFNPVPAPVVGLPKADQIALGGDRSCARIGTGMSCWGKNYNKPPTTDSTPTNVAVPKPVKHIVMGRTQVCALLDSDEIACAGYLLAYTEFSADGGGPGQATMAMVPGLSGVAQMSESNAHICVLKKGGAVLCWGRDTWGQLGRGTMGGPSLIPAPVTLPASGKALAAGVNHTCALLADDTVWCWGRNNSVDDAGTGYGSTNANRRPRGQVGALPNGTVDSANPTPRKIDGLPAGALVNVVAGYDHSCALTATGAVYCWGANKHGELGLGKQDGGGLDNAAHPTASRVLF